MSPNTSHWVLDLDGVMWRGDDPIGGSTEAVGELLGLGDQVVFCTNNSSESGSTRKTKLLNRGIPDGFEVVTSADAVATLVESGSRVLSVGGAGLAEALAARGAEVTDIGGSNSPPHSSAEAHSSAEDFDRDQEFDDVVVGLNPRFDYQMLDLAAAAVRRGARLLVSNTDTAYPGSGGIHPGTGSLVAAVEAASGRPSVPGGKPNEPMAALLRDIVGTGPGIVVGDNGETDGRLAEKLGLPFGLVLTGVTEESDLPLAVPVDFVADDLASLVARRSELIS